MILVHCAVFALASMAAWCQKPRADSAPAPSAGGPPINPELRRQLGAIRDAALESDYAWHQLEHLTENIGPRPAGSPAAQAAAEYVASELRKIGLDVHLEPAQVSHWVRGEEKGELVEYPGQARDTTQRLVLTALSGSSATPADGLTADVVVVHSFEIHEQWRMALDAQRGSGQNRSLQAMSFALTQHARRRPGRIGILVLERVNESLNAGRRL